MSETRFVALRLRALTDKNDDKMGWRAECVSIFNMA